MTKYITYIIFLIIFTTNEVSAGGDDPKISLTEIHTITRLDTPNNKRVYILDPVFPHLTIGKLYVHDANDGSILGMIDTGYVPNILIAPDHSELYVVESYWSRGSRGVRTDIVTVYDPQTLSPKTEIILPNGRFFVVPKRHSVDISNDGKYLYSYTMSPMSSVSIIDIKEKKYLGEVEIPGCSLVFPTTLNSFVSMCANGSLMTVEHDHTLKTKVKRTRAFFDIQNDPVFEHAGFDRKNNIIHFITYSGKLYSVDLSSENPKVLSEWKFVSNELESNKWRPGGWDLVDFHDVTGRLYVIMHQGPAWTHKEPGSEVWELDIKRKEILRRFKLIKNNAYSIAVTSGPDPILLTISSNSTFSGISLDKNSIEFVVEDTGDSPHLIYVEGN